MIDFRRLHANAPGGPTGVAIGPVDPKVWLPNPAGKSMWWQPSQPVEGTCSTASMYLLDMVKDYITRTRASIKGAVRKARDTAGRALVV